uniref:acyltransferase n=1 Tax=Acetatifactor sp. TaxID=1872090 RepID=UPI004056BE47
MGNKDLSKRNIAFDLLRIISAFSVVILHASTFYIVRNTVDAVEFKVANFYDSISRFGVPVFVMISGAIFLGEQKEVTMKRLWSRNILRLFILYWVWSFGYYVFQSLYYWKFDFWRHGIVRTVTGCVYSSDHFWFLFMIMGLYALVPCLRTWIAHAEKRELKYFVGLFIVFQILRTTATLLIDKTVITEISEMMRILELSGYLGYFVLGYVLVKYGLPKKWKLVLYSLIPVGVVVNYVVSDYMSQKNGTYSPGIYDSFGLFTFIMIVAIFVFFLEKCSDSRENGSKGRQTVIRMVQSLSKDTLGIYLMHVGLLDLFSNKNFIIGSMPAVIGVPLVSILAFVICGLVSAVLRRIPLIGRYLA